MSLFTSSVASITASLQTMVEKLEAHAEAMKAKTLYHMQAASVARSEAEQAGRVREKLTGILD